MAKKTGNEGKYTEGRPREILKWVWGALAVIYIVVWIVIISIILEGQPSYVISLIPVFFVCPAIGLASWYASYRSRAAGIVFLVLTAIFGVVMLGLILYLLLSFMSYALVIVPVIMLVSFLAWYVILCVMVHRNRRIKESWHAAHHGVWNGLMRAVLDGILVVLWLIILVVWLLNAYELSYGTHGLSSIVFAFLAEPVTVLGLTFALFYSRYKSMAASITAFVLNIISAAGIFAFTAYLLITAQSSSAYDLYSEILIALFIIWYVVICVAEGSILWNMHKDRQHGMLQQEPQELQEPPWKP